LLFILDETNESFLDILAKIHKNGMRRTLGGKLRDHSCIGFQSYLCDEGEIITLHDPYMHERFEIRV
jgi:hypothetical protein